jgi:hypothetical protein
MQAPIKHAWPRCPSCKAKISRTPSAGGSSTAKTALSDGTLSPLPAINNGATMAVRSKDDLYAEAVGLTPHQAAVALKAGMMQVQLLQHNRVGASMPAPPPPEEPHNTISSRTYAQATGAAFRAMPMPGRSNVHPRDSLLPGHARVLRDSAMQGQLGALVQTKMHESLLPSPYSPSANQSVPTNKYGEMIFASHGNALLHGNLAVSDPSAQAFVLHPNPFHSHHSSPRMTSAPPQHATAQGHLTYPASSSSTLLMQGKNVVGGNAQNMPVYMQHGATQLGNQATPYAHHAASFSANGVAALPHGVMPTVEAPGGPRQTARVGPIAGRGRKGARSRSRAVPLALGSDSQTNLAASSQAMAPLNPFMSMQQGNSPRAITSHVASNQQVPMPHPVEQLACAPPTAKQGIFSEKNMTVTPSIVGMYMNLQPSHHELAGFKPSNGMTVMQEITVENAHGADFGTICSNQLHVSLVDSEIANESQWETVGEANGSGDPAPADTLSANHAVASWSAVPLEQGNDEQQAAEVLSWVLRDDDQDLLEHKSSS